MYLLVASDHEISWASSRLVFDRGFEHLPISGFKLPVYLPSPTSDVAKFLDKLLSRAVS